MLTGAIILAAGKSEEMREAKPMVCIDGAPAIAHILRTLSRAKISPVAVVTGYRADMLERFLEGRKVIVVRNRRFEETRMLDSVKLGLAALQGKCDRVLIVPGDLPLIQKETLQKLLDTKAVAAQPGFQGAAGHPLLIGKQLFPAILGYIGDGSIRDILTEAAVVPELIPVEDEAVLLDGNSYEGFERLNRMEAERKGRGKLHLQCEWKLAVDEVIMDRETMQLMEMITYTGSLQLAGEHMRIPYTRCWRIIKNMEKELGVAIIKSSTGGSKGGGSRLTEEGKQLLESYQAMLKEGEKMSSWLFKEYFSDILMKNAQKIE